MKKLLIPFIEKTSPETLNIYRAINNRRIIRKKHETFQQEIKKQLFPQEEIKVLSGPCKGLKYIDEVVWGSIAPNGLDCMNRKYTPS